MNKGELMDRIEKKKIKLFEFYNGKAIQSVAISLAASILKELFFQQSSIRITHSVITKNDWYVMKKRGKR